MRCPITTTIETTKCEEFMFGRQKRIRVKGLEDWQISDILNFGIDFLLAEKMQDPINFPHPTNSQTDKLARAMERLNGIQEQKP